MIPRLNLQETLERDYALFLKELGTTEFSGEIRTDYGSRLVTSTDNSIYQILPQAVVLPKSAADIACIFQLAQQERFSSIKFSPRGGGTGTNGQSLTSGIVVDCSKYMNRILEINLKEKWVRVEPGVVLDQLNGELKGSGFFFAPTLSPSNRATLGGMINTDACGKGSRIYGRTSNHVLELNYTLQDGTHLTSSEVDLKQLEQFKEQEGIVGHIYREVDAIVGGKRDLIKDQFPKISRFMTGYNLGKVYSDDEKHFNMNYLLSGSEGTLAFITEAKLKLTPVPKYKHLLVVKYQSFDDALGDAQVLLESDPAAIETIDEKILSLAKGDEIYHYIEDFVKDEEHSPTRTVNLVEFVGNNARQLETRVKRLCRVIEKHNTEENRAIGYYHTEDPKEIGHLWNLRKKGVGLLGNAEGKRRPIPFIEDTVVPPENLAAYIAEFKALFAKHDLEYGMFGHVDVGCLHVRPALNMRDEKDEALVRELSDCIAGLVKKYGGVMWGEHGVGYRAEYTPMFFGRELYQDLRKIKEAFDPQNKLNPGKIVTPYSTEDKVVSLEAPLRGHFNKQIPEAVQDEFADAINCNGNGACFNYDPDSVMCPSSKVTRDRIHSPKGRAGMMREWLRQLEMAQADNGKQLLSGNGNRNLGYALKSLSLLKNKVKNTWGLNKGDYDFSQEVHEAMKGCLACKACAAQCPIHVDVPEFRSKFFELYYTRYMRPVRDYFIGNIEYMAPVQAKFARWSNQLMDTYPAQFLLRNIVKLCDAPKLSLISVKEGLQARHALPADPVRLSNLSDEEKSRSVILVQDVFTTFYEAQLVLDIYDLLRMLGYVVYVTPFLVNGKPMHIKGFLNYFKTTAQKNVKYLQKVGTHGVPIVGIEPSMVMTYRDEYLKILETDNLGFEVHLLQEWLSQDLERFKAMIPEDRPTSPAYQLFGHCMELTGALDAQVQWKQVFEALGIELAPTATGCCGMSGTYGHETEHYHESKGIYEMGWAKHIAPEAEARQHLVATGYSCRSQVKRLDGFKPLHPAQALLRELSR